MERKKYSAYVGSVYSCLEESNRPLSKQQIAHSLGIDICKSPGENRHHDLLIHAIDTLRERGVIECVSILKDLPHIPETCISSPEYYLYYLSSREEELVSTGIIEIIELPVKKGDLNSLANFFDYDLNIKARLPFPY